MDFIKKLVKRLVNYTTHTPAEFDQLEITNHRARLNTNLTDMYDNDRDVESVKHSMHSDVSPIAILEITPSTYVVLDGAHRIAAAYLTNTAIIAANYKEK
jgi:hypothetical protein